MDGHQGQASENKKETLSNGLDIQISNVKQLKIKHRKVHRSKYSVFWYHQRLGFLSLVTLEIFTFSVNKDAKESCVYLQIIHKTEHTQAPNFAAEILP